MGCLPGEMGSPERGPWSRVLPLPEHPMGDGGLFFIPSAQVEKKIGICGHTEVCGDPELIGVGTLDPSCLVAAWTTPVVLRLMGDA